MVLSFLFILLGPFLIVLDALVDELEELLLLDKIELVEVKLKIISIMLNILEPVHELEKRIDLNLPQFLSALVNKQSLLNSQRKR